MSGYWDALDRAAAGAPGSATPRPRGLFEPVAGFTDPGAELAFEDGFDLQGGAPEIASFTAGPSSTASALLPAAEVPPGAPIPPAATVSQTAPAPPDTALRPSEPAPPPVASNQTVALAPVPPPPSAPDPARSVEIARVETTRTVLETVLRLAAEPAQAAPVAQPAMAGSTMTQTPSEAVAVPAPVDIDSSHMLVRAEPIAAPTASTPTPIPQPLPEPSPLVVEIGRIDVRIVSESAAAPAPIHRREPEAALSLNDYLTRRGGAGG